MAEKHVTKGTDGGGFSNPDIPDPFGMWRLAPPPTPYLTKGAENVIISESAPGGPTRLLSS